MNIASKLIEDSGKGIQQTVTVFLAIGGEGNSCHAIARDMGVSASTISRLQKPVLQNAGEV